MPRTRCNVLHCLMLVAVAATVFGCASHPVRVCMQGDIAAEGQIKTVLATDNNAPPVRARTLPREPACAAKIALIDVDGLLINRNLSGSNSLGENPVAFFREKLDAVAADPCVAAVLLRINSPGGGVTASDIMRRDLESFRQRTGKPVVACLMDLGCGGAYYLASASDLIVAHPTTLTGGLGVILNRYELTDTLGTQNVVADPIRSGSKVDIGSPTRAFPGFGDAADRADQYALEDTAILQKIADEYHERLQSAVKAARPALDANIANVLPPPEVDAEPASYEPLPFDGTVFDGRVILASEAQQRGLIDQIGYLDDAIITAEGLAGISKSRTVVYRRSNDRALTAYDITPNLPTSAVSLPLSIPGLDRSQLPVYLYLWQPDPLLERTGGL